MAKEVKTFNSADAAWKRMMKTARDYPGVKKWAEDYLTK
jgi:hypothetical protein